MPKGLGTQIVAGILGLLFVIGLVLLGRKLGQDLRQRFLAQDNQRQEEVTPTPPLNEMVGLSPTGKESEGRAVARNGQRDDGPGEALAGNTLNGAATTTKGGVTEIPATGAESLLLTAFLLPAGLYLRRRI